MLDEPNSNLDDVGERALGVALQKLKETGATVFIVSHRPNILTRLDRILVMAGGSISLYGERDRVIAELAAQQAKLQRGSQAEARRRLLPRQLHPCARGRCACRHHQHWRLKGFLDEQ